MNSEIEALDRIAHRATYLTWPDQSLTRLVDQAQVEANELREMIRANARHTSKRAIANELALRRMQAQSAYVRWSGWGRITGYNTVPNWMYGE